LSLKIGIIGHGFVGSAVANGFDKDVDQFVVDPLFHDNTIDDLVKYDPPLTFVCVPTPEQDTHMDVDVSIAREVLIQLENLNYKGIVVIKSTITPDHLTTFKKTFKKLKLVYNPEFLTEANSLDDFVNPNMQILGGKWRDCEAVEKAYIRHSSVKIVPTFKVDMITASLIKYSINSWLATKVSWFNQLHELFQKSGAKGSWEQFTDMLKRDPRMGDSHMQVPGPDGKFGYGGHCFPKDTKALLYYSKLKKAELKLLKASIEYNSTVRND
jgi:UDPglucose 6-dehydrogenase